MLESDEFTINFFMLLTRSECYVVLAQLESRASRDFGAIIKTVQSTVH